MVSSVHEGFSNVIAEAICLKVPVVSTDIDYGPREILAPLTDPYKRVTDNIEISSCGILTPKCDGNMYDGREPITKEETLLAEGIIRILTDQKLYLFFKSNIENRIADLDVSRMVSKWIELIGC